MCKEMADNSDNGGNGETDGKEPACTSCGGQVSLNQSIGGGKAADILLWKRRHISFGVIIVATIAWLLFEHSGLPFLTVCSDVLLVLVVLLFIRAKYAVYRNKPPQTLQELVLSEEMVNNAAASFRVKINNVLFMAHDITLGKDFTLFFKVVACLWLLSVTGSFLSFFTMAYIGTIISITVPAVYSKYKAQMDMYGGMIRHQFSKHYKIMDENFFSRLHNNLPIEKES